MQDLKLYKKPLMSWNSENDGWFNDINSSIFLFCTELVLLDSDEETDNSSVEVIISSLLLPFSDKMSDYFRKTPFEIFLALESPCYALILSTDELIAKSYEPITDLLDFYYEEKISEILYQRNALTSVEVPIDASKNKLATEEVL
ncbi:481_t:CDS:2 [Cetraspora pellucida]|uniref:481_t:CDS:1 n=1 Tax=Cetraspora pellucida TaxID=1433469 RepID=A0ACA9K439_9GLOM|nr:481_t:CDS:2 [Cetraspora pellucida]